jgi:hypothetical protein
MSWLLPLFSALSRQAPHGWRRESGGEQPRGVNALASAPAPGLHSLTDARLSRLANEGLAYRLQVTDEYLAAPDVVVELPQLCTVELEERLAGCARAPAI